MSCALWLKHLGLTPIIIEQNAKLGGQLLHLNRVNRWVLGYFDKTSTELAGIYVDHIKKENIQVICRSSLLNITANLSGYDISIEVDGNLQSLSTRALVIATGVRVLSHEIFGKIPGFQSIYDSGLISFYPIAHLDYLPTLKGKTIAVIGGGDNAYYTAKDVALAGAHVYLLSRSNPKARSTVRQEVVALIENKIISVRTGVELKPFRQHQYGVEITFLAADFNPEQINVDMVFARTGFAANSEFLDAFEAFSGLNKESGYIKTDSAKCTSIPWLYAVGDVANAKHQSVVNAIAEGAIAAQDISEQL